MSRRPRSAGTAFRIPRSYTRRAEVRGQKPVLGESGAAKPWMLLLQICLKETGRWRRAAACETSILILLDAEDKIVGRAIEVETKELITEVMAAALDAQQFE